MAQVKIWHMDTERMSEDSRRALMMPAHNLTDDARERITAAFAADEYVAVALIEIGNDPAPKALDRAYKLTQNGVVSDSWSLDPPLGVSTLGAPYHEVDEPAAHARRYGRRSSMCGDVFEFNGVRYLCAMVGWTEL